jgi:hypothetical protein
VKTLVPAVAGNAKPAKANVVVAGEPIAATLPLTSGIARVEFASDVVLHARQTMHVEFL